MNKKTIKIIVNALTLTRLVGALFLPFVIYRKTTLFSIVYLTLIFTTDLLDGLLARRFNVSTKGGFHLDQLCDKVFALTVLISFVGRKEILFIPLILELGIAFVNIIRAINSKSGASSMLGKAKTLVFSITLVLGAINVMDAHFLNKIVGYLPRSLNILRNVDLTISDGVLTVFVLLTAVMELITMYGYIKEAVVELKYPVKKISSKEKIRSFADFNCIIGRLWDEKRFLEDRDRPVQNIVQEELVKLHSIR